MTHFYPSPLKKYGYKNISDIRTFFSTPDSVLITGIHCTFSIDYCTGNESYTCVAACQRNCDNYKQPLSPICQTLSCTVGCGCQSGYVRRHGIAGECVLEADCERK